MIVATKVKHFLDSHPITYRVIRHERTQSLQEVVFLLNIPPQNVLQSVVLKNNEEIVLFVLPLNKTVDLKLLSHNTGKFWEIVSEKEVDKWFDDCEPGCHPPFGKAYHMFSLLDESIEALEVVYVETGCQTTLLQISMDDFQFLMEGTPFLPFAVPKIDKGISGNPFITQDIQIVDLPTLPPIARQILDIVESPLHEGVSALSRLISNDEVIRAQILTFAKQFIKKGDTLSKEHKLEGIINDILGFETVSHMAIGVTAGRSIQSLEEGPLVSCSFWRHALYAAALAKKIAEHVPSDYKIEHQLGYLAGFFHNFGYLLLGHLFPPEFRLLNRWLLLHPRTPVEVLEKRVVGMGKAKDILDKGHARLGSWLMQHWKMPEAIVIATAFHHTQNYQGEYSNYVLLLQLTNQLLRTVGIGDGQSGKVKPEKCHSLGITLEVVESCMKSVQSDMQELDEMAMVLMN